MHYGRNLLGTLKIQLGCQEDFHASEHRLEFSFSGIGWYAIYMWYVTMDVSR